MMIVLHLRLPIAQILLIIQIPLTIQKLLIIQILLMIQNLLVIQILLMKQILIVMVLQLVKIQIPQSNLTILTIMKGILQILSQEITIFQKTYHQATTTDYLKMELLNRFMVSLLSSR